MKQQIESIKAGLLSLDCHNIDQAEIEKLEDYTVQLESLALEKASGGDPSKIIFSSGEIGNIAGDIANGLRELKTEYPPEKTQEIINDALMLVEQLEELISG